MANISDIIEQFILDTMKQDSILNLSRNELASFFNCSPSQINYVLSTRFTNDRGFIVTSQRGGGGYIKLTRINLSDEENVAKYLLGKLSAPIDYASARQLISGLEENDYITEDEEKLILAGISPKALSSPINNENNLRAQILKGIVIEILERRSNNNV